MPMKITIISGGQTGVDTVGVMVAKKAGLPTGGWMPRGFRTEDGPAPWMGLNFGLQETADSGYAVRTEMNAKWGDMTFWFGEVSPGYWCTKRACDKHKRKFVVNPTGNKALEAVEQWIKDHPGQDLVINIAGNRKSKHPAASAAATRVLTLVFTELVEIVKDLNHKRDQ